MVEGLGHEHNQGQAAVSFSHGNQWRIDWVMNITMVKAAVYQPWKPFQLYWLPEKGKTCLQLDDETVTDEWRPVSWCSWWVYFSMLSVGILWATLTFGMHL